MKTSLKFCVFILVLALFFALPALAIASSGYVQVPATSEPSAPPANPIPIRSKLGPAQRVAAAKTPVGISSASPSSPARVAPPQNKADPGGQPVSDQDTVIRLQIFLDEHSFGPGKIDGRWGEFIGKALQRFQAANGQQPSGQIDSALQEELQKISPVYTTYTLTDSDLNWVGKVPSKPGEMARLKRILYRSALDYVAERYHADPAFIRKLNSGRNLDDLKKGSAVQVPNVQPFQIETIQPVPDLPPRPEFAQRIIRVDTRRSHARSGRRKPSHRFFSDNSWIKKPAGADWYLESCESHDNACLPLGRSNAAAWTPKQPLLYYPTWST